MSLSFVFGDASDRVEPFMGMVRSRTFNTAACQSSVNTTYHHIDRASQVCQAGLQDRYIRRQNLQGQVADKELLPLLLKNPTSW